MINIQKFKSRLSPKRNLVAVSRSSQTNHGALVNEAHSIQSLHIPPVLTLPNEVLYKIFSCLPMTSVVLIKDDSFANDNDSISIANGQVPYAHTLLRHPILVLRQVCHRFRFIANELSLWYD